MIRRKTGPGCAKAPMPEGPRRDRTAGDGAAGPGGLVALLLAVTVVRNSAVDALADLDPALASAFLEPPSRARDQSCDDRDRAGRSSSQRLLRRRLSGGSSMPRKKRRWRPNLSSSMASGEQVAGRPVRAQQAFLAAEWRDPRSLPAHYFLAEHYFPGSRRRERSYGNRKPRQPFARTGSAAPHPISPLLPGIAPIGRGCGRCFGSIRGSKMRH